MKDKKELRVMLSKRFKPSHIRLWRKRASKLKMNLTKWIEQTLNKSEL